MLLHRALGHIARLPECTSAFCLAPSRIRHARQTKHHDMLSQTANAPAQGPVCDEIKGQGQANQRKNTLPVGSLPERQLLADDFIACTAGTWTPCWCCLGTTMGKDV